MTGQASRKSSTRFRVTFWAYVGLSLSLVFYVPTLVPVKLVFSESYFFGYNNRIGFLLFVSLTAIGSLWWRRFTLDLPATRTSEPVSRRSLWICMMAGLVLCLFMYGLTARWGQFRDSTYLINRIELAARGLHPYRDFEFPYGLSFLYMPILLSRLLHLSIPNGYYVFWAMSVIVGIWMLYEIINRSDCPSEHKSTIFMLLSLSMLPGILTTGPNYTGFRFLTAPLFSLILFETIKDGSIKAQIRGSLEAIVFTLMLLLISPEIAVAFCLGVSSFFFLFYMRSENKLWLAPYGCMLLSLILLILTANRFGVFLALKSYASGGSNFPIVPAPHILVLFVSVFFCTCFAAEELSKREFRSNSLLLLLVSLPSLAAALGYCDPLHVIFNALGIFLVCMLRVSNNALIWNWYRFVFAVTFIVLDLIGGQLIYLNPIEGAVASLSRSQTTPDLTTDPILMPSGLKGPAMVPFGYFPSHSPTGLDGGYYFGTLNALTPEAVAAKILELAHQPTKDLVLPEHYDGWCHIAPDMDKLSLSIVLAYPFRWRAVHKENVFAPLCDYIQQNYFLRVAPQPDTYRYGIWTRR
jgi:hypothetical protein